MLTKLSVLAASFVLLVVVLIGAAAGAAINVLASPLDVIGAVGGIFTGDLNTLVPQGAAPTVNTAQFCSLGAITPGRNTGYGTYTTAQIENATTIYQVSVSLGLPPYAAVIAIATAMQESSLNNLNYGDRDSLGLFQQRPSQGWGTAAQITDPVYAATKFYDALVKVKNWQGIPLTQAAQDVQRSAYPDAYAHWQTDAEYLVSTVSGALVGCQSQ